MPKYDDPRSFVPDDWRRLPSGLYVKVWTAAELDPEERKLVVGAVHAFADDLGWRIAVATLRHQAVKHDSSLN